MIFKIVHNILWPYRSIEFYQIYHSAWQQVVIWQDASAIRLFRFIIGLALFQSLKYAAIFVLHPSEHVRLLWYDPFYLVTSKHAESWMLCLQGLTIASLFYLYYFRWDAQVIAQLYKFINPNKSYVHDQFIWNQHRGLPMVEYLCKFAKNNLKFTLILYGVACKLSQ